MNIRKTMILAAAAASTVLGDAVTVSVDGTHPGRALPNVQQMLTPSTGGISRTGASRTSPLTSGA